MDFRALIRHLQGDFAHLREEEVLMIVRNSPMRRFRVQVNSQSSGKLRWTPVRIRAIQGHRAFFVEQGGMASIIKKMYTFDPDFDVAKVDDPMVHPGFSAAPEGSPVWDEFPRVIYHTCDQAAFNSIVKHGLVPGGFPYKTGRAHNFFNSTPPWKAEMKKLQGTRAGRPIAIAFDTELLMQMGFKLFATDEAILSPDWISNMALINAYDMRSGEFFYINRAYVNHRKAYQEILKEAKERFGTDDILNSKMEMYTEDAQKNFEGIKARIEFGKLLVFSRREDLQVEKSTATREGEAASGSQLVGGYTVAKRNGCRKLIGT
jgi:RNA:NAD 2'-phosphotransferase (TPT1/KptA family)